MIPYAKTRNASHFIILIARFPISHETTVQKVKECSGAEILICSVCVDE
jgi:hypothetical protein